MRPDAAVASAEKPIGAGIAAEWLAALALMVKGFRIVARRYRTPLGEIDLIARRGDLVLHRRGQGATNADARRWRRSPYPSERRIEGAADLWLTRQRDHARLSMRFDLVAVLALALAGACREHFHGRN